MAISRMPLLETERIACDVFFDTSALVKYFHEERGTEVVTNLTAPPIAMHATPIGMTELISHLRGLIESTRRQALRAVDAIQVRTCWEIGRHIVEFEQQGADRAAYGTRLIPRLAESLTSEFGGELQAVPQTCR